MGVPKFFRWVAERFPLVITPFVDSPPPIDNLYLDMNGIIHHCTHPNDIDATRRSPTEKEMVEAMFAYLEKLFQAIQPRKYFLLAVDGVAPRAKMNQQRQRRYRSGYEMMQARAEALDRGDDVPDESDVFDSNCITPGTEFMARISEHFKYFIAMKLHQDSAWRNCQIIFSGHDHPGEGEHKIVDFIRRRKMQPDYNPNETHCMYGLDADLIMLALATHEPHFVLLREVVTFDQGSKKERERRQEDEAKGIKEDKGFTKADSFVLFHVNILREYLELDISRNLDESVVFDFERVVDDFVFMCFFIGNDFLPAIPTLGINDGSIPQMLDLYKDVCLRKGTYLTRGGGEVNWNAVELFLNRIGELELDTLRARQEEEQEFQKRQQKLSGEVLPSIVPITTIVEYKQRYYGDKHRFEDGWNPRGEELAELRQHYIEGLMWVQQYYYQGPASWKWYYPHHYAPLASDLVGLSAIASKVRFVQGEPFLPHQQLLAVLPPMSHRSMPPAYWPLFTQTDSPLSKYFPQHLEIDREGARAPWEGTVLIPFMDEDHLLKAYHSVQQKVSDEANARNKNRKPTLFRVDKSVAPFDIPSSMFKTLQGVQIRRVEYDFPPAKRFVPALCPGVRIKEKQMEGMSSLHSKLNVLSPVREIGAVNIFGMLSKRESILLKFAEPQTTAPVVDTVVNLIGEQVWVGYPHYKRGRVVAASCSRKLVTARFDRDGNFTGVDMRPLTGEESMNFRKDLDTHSSMLKAKLGLVLPQSDILVTVNRHVGMRVSKRGDLVHQWARKDTTYPLSIITPLAAIDMLADPRYVEQPRDDRDFTIGSSVVYIGPNPKGHKGQTFYGCVGKVLTKFEGEDGLPVLGVDIGYYPKSRLVSQSLVDYASPTNWTSLAEVAKSLRISSQTLSQITSSITVSPQWGSFELGMGMKFTSKNLSRVGLAKLVQSSYNPWYVGQPQLFEKMEEDTDVTHHLELAKNASSKRDENKGERVLSGRGIWYFSKQAIAIITEYCTKFAPLVARIECGGASPTSFDPTSMLTGPWQTRDCNAVVKEITTWIESMNLFKLPMVSAADDAVPAEIVAQLEAAIENSPSPVMQIAKLNRVQERHVYVPTCTLPQGFIIPIPLPIRGQKFALGNRVTYCRTTGVVPFGASGTIVRILGDGRSCEVVFDEVFQGGTTLNGRLRTARGALCKLAALLVTADYGVAEPATPMSTTLGANARATTIPSSTMTPPSMTSQNSTTFPLMPSPPAAVPPTANVVTEAFNVGKLMQIASPAIVSPANAMSLPLPRSRGTLGSPGAATDSPNPPPPPPPPPPAPQQGQLPVQQPRSVVELFDKHRSVLESAVATKPVDAPVTRAPAPGSAAMDVASRQLMKRITPTSTTEAPYYAAAPSAVGRSGKKDYAAMLEKLVTERLKARFGSA